MKIPRLPTVFHALRRLVWAFIRGQSLFVGYPTAQRRAYICRNRCGFYDGHTDQCSHCACFVGVKCQFATERCPVHRWGMEWEDHRP